ncbi:putative nucleic acid-binding protein [Nostoc sp. NIES-4103]|nr:putative nucleic acid-binding protein [Nostoc sp. NIES-4103]
MTVVCNTSPITNLAAIAQLDLLCQLYGEIVISVAVYDELTALPNPVPGTLEVQTLSWIQVHRPYEFINKLPSLFRVIQPGSMQYAEKTLITQVFGK